MTTTPTPAPAAFVPRIAGEKYSDYEARLVMYNATVPIEQQAPHLGPDEWFALTVGTPAPADDETAETSTVADLQAQLAAAQQKEAEQAAELQTVSLDTLDARVTELERRLDGGARE